MRGFFKHSENIVFQSCFSSSVTKQTYKINHQFDCNEKCLVYLLTCNKFLKQYIEQNINIFGHRWNNYKSTNRKFQRSESCIQEHLYRDLSNTGQNGFFSDVSVLFKDLSFADLSYERMNLFSRYFINFSLTFLFIVTSIITMVTLLL